ncbi:response regulator transcription factor [Lacinutrix sp. Hel_I_90]|uniref:response regulator transcription factor n=1 Tax=Lacinutrix sp. Hel_I_90 TaxID=1249999 RepID=UPI0005C816B5|nr:response regulator transcription factor [Lacinutrix sp. Hel_I_90]
MNIKKPLSLTLFSFVIILTTISSKRDQSLVQYQKSALEDSIRKNIYNNPDKAIFFIHKYLKQTKKKDKVLMAYGALGVAHDLKNNTDSTLFYLNKGLMLCENPSDIIAFKYDIGKTYEKQYNFEYALLLYKQCYDLAKKERLLEEYNKIKHSLALMENKIGQPNKALILLKEMYKAENSIGKEIKNLKFTRKNLSETYLNINEPDSAILVINEGLKAAKNNNNIEFQYHFHSLKARAYLEKKRYSEAEEEAYKALKSANGLDNVKFKNEANYIVSLVNKEQKKYGESIATIKGILNSETVKTTEDLSKYYKLLASCYDAVDSSEQSVVYFKKFTKTEQEVTEKRLATLDNIYHIDLNEKINDKEKQKSKTEFWLIAFIILGLLGFVFFIWIKIKQKNNQKRFEELMVKINNFEKNKAGNNNLDQSIHLTEIANIDELEEDSEEKDELPEAVKELNYSIEADSESSAYIIDDEKIQEILSKIEYLEEKKYYLKQECTMHNMAKRLKTNTSYLSSIINNHLNKTFSNYINELRINYAIVELKNNKRLRSYSVKAISEEIGYKSADSFSKYFKEATGLTPSVYIKKIGTLS